MNTKLWACVGIGLFAVGCADAAPSDGGEPLGSAPSALVVSRLDGTYDFDLDASDVAGKVRARCAETAGGDASKSASCFDEARNEARDEKIRFSRNAAGQVVWASFAVDASGKEELFLEMPLRFARGPAEHVLVAKATSFPRGSFVITRVAHALKEMTIEAPDASTVVIVDPSKGRLVYHRAR